MGRSWLVRPKLNCIKHYRQPKIESLHFSDTILRIPLIEAKLLHKSQQKLSERPSYLSRKVVIASRLPEWVSLLLRPLIGPRLYGEACSRQDPFHSREPLKAVRVGPVCSCLPIGLELRLQIGIRTGVNSLGPT